MTESDWKTRAEAAEARVKVLERALKQIADAFEPEMDGDLGYYERKAIEKSRAALAAKEKP